MVRKDEDRQLASVMIRRDGNTALVWFKFCRSFKLKNTHLKAPIKRSFTGRYENDAEYHVSAATLIKEG